MIVKPTQNPTAGMLWVVRGVLSRLDNHNAVDILSVIRSKMDEDQLTTS